MQLAPAAWTALALEVDDDLDPRQTRKSAHHQEDGPERRFRRMPTVAEIVLQKSQNAVRPNFRQTTKQAAIVDRCSFKRATEVASEFVTE